MDDHGEDCGRHGNVDSDNEHLDVISTSSNPLLAVELSLLGRRLLEADAFTSDE